MNEHIVVAFGGNAILPSGQRGTLDEQRANVRAMSEHLVSLIEAGHRVVVTHGNGPQVGEIMLKSDLARDVVPPLTLDVAGAMSQGQIGYMLQQEIGNVLTERNLRVPVCSVVTQVVVDGDDPAFSRPTKPIGRFYQRDEADRLRAEKGWSMVEDAGRGYRRVVPSPQPRTIVEWEGVKALLGAGVLVIAAGGGGIPVVSGENGRRGVEAVIDKDLAAQRLASLVGARVLVLLTEVDLVALDFGTPQQRPLGMATVDEMKRYADEGQFPPGSMGPKVRAAIAFLESGGERAIITSTALLNRAVADEAFGTQIVRAPVSGRSRPGELAGSTT
jgi:carbamate kinase